MKRVVEAMGRIVVEEIIHLLGRIVLTVIGAVFCGVVLLMFGVPMLLVAVGIVAVVAFVWFASWLVELVWDIWQFVRTGREAVRTMMAHEPVDAGAGRAGVRMGKIALRLLVRRVL